MAICKSQTTYNNITARFREPRVSDVLRKTKPEKGRKKKKTPEKLFVYIFFFINFTDEQSDCRVAIVCERGGAVIEKSPETADGNNAIIINIFLLFFFFFCFNAKLLFTTVGDDRRFVGPGCGCGTCDKTTTKRFLYFNSHVHFIVTLINHLIISRRTCRF